MMDALTIMRWPMLACLLLPWLVVTSFVQIGGVLLTFSYLIVPAVGASFLTDRTGARLLVGRLAAILASAVGLYGSYRLDLPTGAAVVCALGASLLVIGAAQCWRRAR